MLISHPCISLLLQPDLNSAALKKRVIYCSLHRKRLNRKPRILCFGKSRSVINERMPNARRILQEPVFTYKQKKPVYRNHHTLRMRRRRRKLSLNLTTDELSESKDSHSDSELECGKSFGSRSRCDRGTGSRAYTKRVYSQSCQSMAGGCGRQHSRLQCGDVQRKNIDDTTPEELASYFDQLLYIPKPMSAMAEMMYT